MEKKDYILIAIDQMSNATKFSVWALESKDEEKLIEWTNEALKYIENAKYWIDKSNILPF